MLYGPGWRVTARDARASVRPESPPSSIPDPPEPRAAAENRAGRLLRSLPRPGLDAYRAPSWSLVAAAVAAVMGASALIILARARTRRRGWRSE